MQPTPNHNFQKHHARDIAPIARHCKPRFPRIVNFASDY